MKIEHQLWNKHFVVLRPVPGLLYPTGMALAQVESTVYCNRGAARNPRFREELGRTPYQCICESKMHRACELLKGTDQTIANIAAQLGVEPDSHFSRLFKRVIGVAPKRYRSGASMPAHRLHHD